MFSDGKTYTSEEFLNKTGMSDGTAPDTESILISEEGVRKLLANLNPNKASGPDQISPRVLKELATELAPILTVIFQSSLSTGCVPSDWRDAHVSPIYKKGEQYNPANYRPVSLTCITCKLMEHIVVSALMDHLEGNHTL